MGLELDQRLPRVRRPADTDPTAPQRWLSPRLPICAAGQKASNLRPALSGSPLLSIHLSLIINNDRVSLTFRTRLAVVAAAAVALSVVLASVVVFVVMKNELRGQLDDSLRSRAAAIANGPFVPHPEQGPNGRPYLELGPIVPRDTWGQAVSPAGATLRTFGAPALAVDRRAREAARGSGGEYFSDVSLGGREYRVLTIPGNGTALQLARDLTEVNGTLHRVGILLILIVVGGMAVAAGLGLLVARAALAPVRQLTAASERVTRTGDLSERIPTRTRDELGRLAGSFNGMLAALEASISAQRQLVADASHELRTPLTSLRTNVEVLVRRGSALEQADRRQLLDDVVEQLGEMTRLIGQLIQLAAGDVQSLHMEELRFDLLVSDAVERARRNRPSLAIDVRLSPTLVYGSGEAFERALGNLLDNAAKWSPPDGTIEVVLEGAELTIRDHGPGISEEDVPHVFARFYRSRAARGLPGSGLGLAIVKQVVESHGGAVAAERAAGGGTVMRLRLPIITVQRINEDGSRMQRLAFPQPSRDPLDPEC